MIYMVSLCSYLKTPFDFAKVSSSIGETEKLFLAKISNAVVCMCVDAMSHNKLRTEFHPFF
jgi:hypothetical protein